MLILLFAGAIYFFIMAFFTLIGVCMVFPKKTPSNVTAVTILIVARNEEHRLPVTLESLKHLDLDGLDAEFIFVDDASSDATGMLMNGFTSNHSVRVIRIDEKDPLLPGKKDGITQAVTAAKGTVIFMTDADCTVRPQWIKTMLPYFYDNVGMLLGHVIYKNTGIRGLTGAMEALCGTIFTFAWAGWNFSPYCRGANLAFSKQAFEESDGYADTPVIASGDDMFLLQKIRRQFRAVPVYDRSSFVMTELHAHFNDHIAQKKRKYAKNFRYEWPHQVLFLAGILFYLLILVNMLFAVPFAATAFFIITTLAWLIFAIGALRLSSPEKIPLFPFFFLWYPCEVIVFSVWGKVTGYRWKSENNIQ